MLIELDEEGGVGGGKREVAAAAAGGKGHRSMKPKENVYMTEIGAEEKNFLVC